MDYIFKDVFTVIGIIVKVEEIDYTENGLYSTESNSLTITLKMVNNSLLKILVLDTVKELYKTLEPGQTVICKLKNIMNTECYIDDPFSIVVGAPVGAGLRGLRPLGCRLGLAANGLSASTPVGVTWPVGLAPDGA